MALKTGFTVYNNAINNVYGAQCIDMYMYMNMKFYQILQLPAWSVAATVAQVSTRLLQISVSQR